MHGPITMKKLSLFVFLALLICCRKPVQSINQEQWGEFTVHDNGLIYDSATIIKLRKTVDSLNLRFKTCAPKRFRSLEQGYGTYVWTLADSVEAHKVMTRAMTVEKLVKTFPSATVLKDIWIAKAHVKNRFNRKAIEYFSTEPSVSVYVPDVASNEKSTGWVFDYEYPVLQGVYVRNLRSREIPAEYGALIRYVDCLIDTTATIFPAARTPQPVALPKNESRLKTFLALAADFEPAPEEPEYIGDDTLRWQRWDEYLEDMENWNDRRLAALDREMEDPANVKLLNDAVDEAIANQNGFAIDEYAARYLAPARVLSLKRSFRPFSTCGSDMRPRNHAKAICQLAAKVNQRDIFLRAHLDVMNNYFYVDNEPDPATGRKTYTKELEQLGVNTLDLLIGIGLRSRNVNINHYQGALPNIARALSESAHQPEVIDLLLTMIMDERLDLFNRVVMAQILFLCNREQVNTPAYQVNRERAKQAIATLPKPMQKSFAQVMAARGLAEF